MSPERPVTDHTTFEQPALDSTGSEPSNADRHRQDLHAYLASRQRSIDICAPLETEDYVIQTMPDVSPPKWHLAHTSWFFETFILAEFEPTYTLYHPQFDTLFNSYYVTHSDPYPRPARGMLSRPTVEQVLAYRAHVDAAMTQLIQDASDSHWQAIQPLLTLGINHEQQHQELMLTDIKNILSINPLQPCYLKHKPAAASNSGNIENDRLRWSSYQGGIVETGHDGDSFAYDNEGPAHRVYLDNFKLATRCITNGEYIDFIESGGYQQAELWLSDGWSTIHAENWQAPLYWRQVDGEWYYFTFSGLRPVDRDAAVCHVSYFEADAYASWANKRLPTEHEWELAAKQLIQLENAATGNFYEQQQYQPVAVSTCAGVNQQDKQQIDKPPVQQMFGDVWEWTASPYIAYPGYKPAQGSIGEYNGKFMSGQMVLRGGSFATAQNHIRATYRNFFYAKDRWQFSGFRLADDG